MNFVRCALSSSTVFIAALVNIWNNIILVLKYIFRQVVSRLMSTKKFSCRSSSLNVSKSSEMILPQAIVIEYWPQNQCEANTGSNNRLIREVPLEVIPAIQHQDRTIESKLLLKKETKRAYAWN